MEASLDHVEEARAKDKWDPPSLFTRIHATAMVMAMAMAIEDIEIFGSGGSRMPALVFDCERVLGETERDGHLPAFNAPGRHRQRDPREAPNAGNVRAVRTTGALVLREDYGRCLRIGGGRERLAPVLDDPAYCKQRSPVDARRSRRSGGDLASAPRGTRTLATRLELSPIPSADGVAPTA